METGSNAASSDVLPFERPKSLTQVVLEHIRARIIDGELGFGEPVSEKALAGDLGISKTPVREAFLQLRAEGLIAVVPRSGTFVFVPDYAEVRDVCELREALELAALELAAARDRATLVSDLGALTADMAGALENEDLKGYRRLDSEYHRTLVERSGNRLLINAYASIAFKIQALRPRLSIRRDRIDASFEDHGRLVDLVDQGMIRKARTLLVRHITNTKRSYLAVIAAADVERP